MFIAALFTIAKTQKQPQCSWTEEWIKTMGYIYMYAMEYYSAIKRMKRFLPFVAKWMDLEIIILSQTVKENM